jgi:uncharacterized membrane protein
MPPLWVPKLSIAAAVIGWVLAIGLPLAVAAWYRRGGAILNAAGMAWIVIYFTMLEATYSSSGDVTIYPWCAIGAIGLAAWGIRETERRYINIGVIAFALTVLTFYFSSVMDKLGRSLALIVGGLLFLGGGYALEQVRRKLVARVPGTGVRP